MTFCKNIPNFLLNVNWYLHRKVLILLNENAIAITVYTRTEFFWQIIWNLEFVLSKSAHLQIVKVNLITFSAVTNLYRTRTFKTL